MWNEKHDVFNASKNKMALKYQLKCWDTGQQDVYYFLAFL